MEKKFLTLRLKFQYLTTGQNSGIKTVVDGLIHRKLNNAEIQKYNL
jgi:hypothetical protein